MIIGIHCRRIDGITYLQEALKTKQPFVIVFNHPTFYDPLVLYHTLKTPLRFVARDDNVKLFGSLLDKYRLIEVTERGGATQKILNAIPYTKLFGSIAIAPAGGTGFEEDASYLPEFKSGAFVPMVPVLPVLIKYSSHEIWKKGVPLTTVFWKRLHAPAINYAVHILPMITPEKSWTPHEFAKKTHQVMQTELRKMIV